MLTAIYVYNSAEFIELLVSQPLQRKTIWMSVFSGLALSLAITFFVGIGIPVLLYEPTATGFMMIGTGLLLSIIFVAIAMLASVNTRDKAKGIGVTILLWLYFSLLFDGLVLFLLFQFSDYPMEKIMVGVSALNPIDLSRILILLNMDISALMGYTGAIFKNIFGTQYGVVLSFLILFMWVVIPAWLSLKKFRAKDL